jgi:restriction system protein
MQDLSPLERRLFDWLSRRSGSFLVILPFAVFLGLGLLGIVAVSAIARRSPFGDTYVTWLITLLVLAALVLYLTAAYAWTAVLFRTHRFKLLQLHQTMRDIQAMSWREFEDLVAASYAARGYAIEPKGGDRPDGGVDLIVKKDDLTWLVQCKHYRDQWVGERPLRELLGVVTAREAAGGVLVACGVFDEKALAFAKGSTKLELVGGEQLRDLVAEAVRIKRSGTMCPICDSPMREKRGRYGPFLGCVNFPACHGWLQIPSGAMPA